MPRLPRVFLPVLALALLTASAAEAAAGGSNLRRPANVGFGCEAALRPNVFTGVYEPQPTGHSTCTLRSLGFIGTSRGGSIVPAGRGRITRIRVRSGANPAPLRLTVLTASGAGDPTGETGGSGSCCTARYHGRVFRPRANGVTTRRTNVRVSNYRNAAGRSFFDVVAVTATGPGTLPLHNEGGQGSYRGALTTFYYPYTRRREPRPEQNAIDGLEVLFRWTWRRGR
jgi:hypothetical protein